jgi:hypothetical protein
MEDVEWSQAALRRNQKGDDNLLVRFELVPRKDEAESTKAGRPVFKDMEYIRIAVPGNRLVQVHRPVRDEDKRRFSQAYAHWQSRKRNLVDGTPLSEWPPVTRSQVEELGFLNVHTVEQLAQLPDAAASQFHGGLALKQKARDSLERAKDGAYLVQMRAELEQRDNETAVLRRQLAEQSQTLEKLSAMVAEQNPKQAKAQKQAG